MTDVIADEQFASGAERTKAEHLAEFHDEMDTQRATAREKQESRGKRSAYDRVIALLDPDSFEELDVFVRHRAVQFGLDKSRPLGDGVVTGFGTIDGRHVAVFSQDFTVFGGSLGEAYAEKMVKLMDVTVARSSVSTTPPARGFRKVWKGSRATAMSSSATSVHPALSRRSRSSPDRAPGALCTPRR
jgi:acetyl-CoA carboxylase beta subunit